MSSVRCFDKADDDDDDDDGASAGGGGGGSTVDFVAVVDGVDSEGGLGEMMDVVVVAFGAADGCVPMVANVVVGADAASTSIRCEAPTSASSSTAIEVDDEG